MKIFIPLLSSRFTSIPISKKIIFVVKYHSMLFSEVIGQKTLKNKLIEIAKTGRTSHALLFSGKEGYGALPLAIAYAQYLNCPDRTDQDSCGVCASCVQMSGLIHPDVHYVYPVNKSKSAESVAGTEGDKPVSEQFIHRWREQILEAPQKGYFNEQMWYKTIDIDNKQGNISRYEADRIIQKLSFKAFGSKYKILIIWLPERMNEQAANALLKILEEPWENTLFFLITESPEKLLKTILSRTQEINVPAIGSTELSLWLQENQSLSESEANRLAHLSFGSLLELQRLTAGEESEDEYFDLFVKLMRLSYEDKHMQLLEWAETIASMGRESQKTYLENSVRLLRNAYMLSMNMGDISYLHGKEYEFCKKFAPFVNNRNIESLVTETERTVGDIARNGNPKIIFSHYALLVSKLVNKL